MSYSLELLVLRVRMLGCLLKYETSSCLNVRLFVKVGNFKLFVVGLISHTRNVILHSVGVCVEKYLRE